MNMVPAGFPAILAGQRRAARLSQAALADRAGLSQRHLSFLETGRSRPGPRSLAGLIAGLGLGAAEADRLLAAAGLAAARPVLAWGDAALAPVQAIVDRLLARHDPAPAYVLDRSGSILAANRGLDRLLELTDPEIWAAVGGLRNFYDLTLHPAGLVRFMVEPERLVPVVLHRLRRAADRDAAAAATLARVRRYPAARRYVGPLAASDHGVLAETYVVAGQRVSFLAVTASFGAADAAATAGIEIECLFAADTATEQLLAGLDA